MTHQITVTIDDATKEKIDELIEEYRKQDLDLKTPAIVRMALKKLFEKKKAKK